MNRSYLVQIFVPTETGKGQPVTKNWFDEFLQELTDKFGGATSFVRSPGQGLWRSGDTTERDDVAVVEVMAAKLAPEFWASLRERLKRELAQEEIVIRAQEIISL
ncbi:hypothetical protein IVB41_12410 [Bradyrhizobium sp. 44]|uniref:hypothetical protein n=1 Tax=Bradyrhizobium sp. 44 TaxID=2782675 RepID=UPI001FFB3F88|nr:hypothetical protein [Bradyrhizobium sp. 44]MCK1284718.1 hypothetical protein [Bradyrhizobium sp. 44]